MQPTGIRLRTDGSTSDPLSALFTQLGPLDLIEFPHTVGSRVLVDNPRLVLALDGNVRASVKITRRTYPAGPVQALGGTVQAVQVVLDYEIALLNYSTQEQVDVLGREQRWFSPQGSRVRADFAGTVRAGGTLTRDSVAVVANGASGDFLGAYKPLVTQVFNGCPEVGTREGSFGLDDAELQPMDARRSLVTALRTGTGELCVAAFRCGA